MVHSHRSFIAAVATTTTILAATPGAYAQEGESLRDAAQNPIADLISLPFQNNTNFDIGHTDNTQNVLNIQPVYPAPPQSGLEPDHPPDLASDLPTAFFLRQELQALEKVSVLTSATPSSAWATSPQSSSFRQESRYSLVPTQVWCGVLGQLFSFQPPQMMSLGPENGPPGRDLSSSCLTSRCT